MIWRCRKPGSERSVQSPGASKPEPENTCTRFGLDQEHLTGKESRGGQDCLNDLRTNPSLLARVEDRSSEIGRLEMAFNELADALAARHAAQQSAEAELRQLNATLESRIEQRTIELEGAVRAKSQFLANMSHEIRTPLNGVLGMLELVRQTELAATQQRFVETARRSGETLLAVINGVLDLSKIEAGKVELERSEFDLREVVEEVTELLSELAYGKGLELACFVPANLPTALIGDPGRLRQILRKPSSPTAQSPTCRLFC